MDTVRLLLCDTSLQNVTYVRLVGTPEQPPTAGWGVQGGWWTREFFCFRHSSETKVPQIHTDARTNTHNTIVHALPKLSVASRAPPAHEDEKYTVYVLQKSRGRTLLRVRTSQCRSRSAPYASSTQPASFPASLKADSHPSSSSLDRRPGPRAAMLRIHRQACVGV